MARLYRDSSPERRQLLRLPSLQGYLEADDQRDPELLKEALNLAFMDYLQQAAPPALYRYFLNQRRRFAPALECFAEAGDLGQLVAALEELARQDPGFQKLAGTPQPQAGAPKGPASESPLDGASQKRSLRGGKEPLLIETDERASGPQLALPQDLMFSSMK